MQTLRNQRAPAKDRPTKSARPVGFGKTGQKGYARVSTQEQNTGRQIDELRAVGCTAIFEEKASGANRARPVLGEVLHSMERGETLVVVKLDRLARSVLHLLDIVGALEDRGAFLRVLGDPIDTSTAQGRFMLQMLGALAELERSTIRDRVMSGLARAARLGRRSGNPRMMQRDRAALDELRAARHRAYLGKLTDGLDLCLPLAVRLREAGETWASVIATLNTRRAYPNDAPWTTARLTRAAKALVREHLAPESLLAKRTDREDTHKRPGTARSRPSRRSSTKRRAHRSATSAPSWPRSGSRRRAAEAGTLQRSRGWSLTQNGPPSCEDGQIRTRHHILSARGQPRAVSVACLIVGWPIYARSIGYTPLDPAAGLTLINQALVYVLIAVALVAAVIAFIDVPFQRFEYIRRQRMTHQEMKEEMKTTEGDPHVKARLRKLRRKRSQRKMLADVPTATVVITNPTHDAVALRYERGKDDAPICVAKGVDRLALRIRETA